MNRTERVAALIREGAQPSTVVRAALEGRDLARDPVRFSMTSDQLIARTVLTDGLAQRLVHATTSSTEPDLYDTRMSERALRRMRTSALENMTIFLNHTYSVPDSVLGSVVGAHLRKEGAVTLLDIEVGLIPEGENPLVDRTFRLVEAGIKLGFSIGAYILEWEWQQADGTPLPEFDEWKDWKRVGVDVFFTILDLLLIESSLVGVPANRQSWVKNARRALVAASVRSGFWRAQAPHKELTMNPLEDPHAIHLAPDAAPRLDGAADPVRLAPEDDEFAGLARRLDPADAARLDTLRAAIESDESDEPGADAGGGTAGPAGVPSTPAPQPAVLSAHADEPDAGFDGRRLVGRTERCSDAELDALEEAFLRDHTLPGPALVPPASRTPIRATPVPGHPDLVAGELVAELRTPSAEDALILADAHTVLTELVSFVAAARSVKADVLAELERLGAQHAAQVEQLSAFRAELARALDIGLSRPTDRRHAPAAHAVRADPAAPLSRDELIRLSDEDLLEAVEAELIA